MKLSSGLTNEGACPLHARSGRTRDVVEMPVVVVESV